ncbi:Ubiquitin-conjugating enzyme family protein [Trichomonas vaginalis G3]|uniref:Ubiquitin-conjugating enzyme family protein n=1 Tax=Trichomonas vaginalis (strain ATCC PRA-98 / G3) TaxID=412133 RepID=A2GLA4_TRIV3|nr:histone ubiquitination [Trichomonas vaginalis G3]EAX82062.1 Ubiquitin-conjugating enzyme family protein [Trichomonas vaginalis G3]KAI5519576.1 histone ubiquitination [Trichomonas vaginalis G3]|eukprot:XP_001294992.1 Ubiquitin-conjugating enzyme family protein [Trichomonas vaginalis G3]
MTAARKAISDYRMLKAMNLQNINARPNENDVLHWYALFYGFESTPWEDGVFSVDIQLPQDYPNSHPVSIRFTTPIIHPNVDANGNVCHNILFNEWDPSYNIYTILISIYLLIIEPNTNEPANPEIAQLYTNNNAEYNRMVHECVENSWLTTKQPDAE